MLKLQSLATSTNLGLWSDLLRINARRYQAFRARAVAEGVCTAEQYDAAADELVGIPVPLAKVV